MSNFEISDKELLNHSLTLENNIKQKINSQQTFSFAQFMQMALYYPGLGYYSSGMQKFGEKGDFVTSPELGNLFAKSIAGQFEQVIKTMENPAVLELGAGTGKFCYDVLLELKSKNSLPEKYYILEVSADLVALQKQTLEKLPKELLQRVEWLSSPPEASFSGVIFANEVLDALPVEVFRKSSSSFEQMKLDVNFEAKWSSFDEYLLGQLEAKQLNLELGYISEFIPNLHHWLESICGSLEKGLVLFVDYGYERSAYYHPERSHGTLVCHHKHKANFDYFSNIGVQDITSFVDFTAVAEAADEVGLNVTGYSTQAHFLMSLGIQNHTGNSEDNYSDYYEKATELKKLVMPNEMGEKFKVIGLTKNIAQDLIGFSINNSLHLL